MSGFYILILSFLLLSLVSKNNNMLLFAVCVIVLILFGGLRTPLDYTDNENYLFFFQYNELSYATSDNFNIGYVILNKVIARYVPVFQFFVFFISCFIAISHAVFIKRYSPNIILSLFLFVLVGYFWSLVTLRQYIAISVSLFAFHYLLKRKLIPFIIFTFIAGSFHTTAFIILPVYFIYWMEMNSRNKFLLFIIFVVAIITFKVLAATFLSGSYYANYLESDQTSSVQRLMMKIYILVVYVLILREKVFEKNIYFLLLLSYLFTIVIYIGGNGIFGVYRLREYFEIGEFIGIPVMFDAIKKSSVIKNKFVYKGMLLFYIVLLIIACHNSLSMDGFPRSYRFFWSL